MKKERFEKAAATVATTVLFFVLGKLSVATGISDIYISWQFAIQSAVAVLYGPAVAMIAGLIGHLMIDITYAGPEWGWIIATVAFGGITGVLMKDLDVRTDSKKAVMIRYNIAHVIANVISWMVIAPGLDWLLHPTEDIRQLFMAGVMASTVNLITTAIAGSLFLFAHMLLLQSKENT